MKILILKHLRFMFSASKIITLSITCAVILSFFHAAYADGKDADDSYPYSETVDERTFTDDLNRTVKIPDIPRRILVLATADVEILFAIGAGERLIGVPDGVRYPPEALGIERVGGMYGNFNAERVVEKDPDLILYTMSSLMQYRSHIDRLESYGLNVLGFKYPDKLDEILTHINAVGNVVGNKKEAARLIDIITSHFKRVTDITGRLSDSQKPRVYFEWVKENARTGGIISYGNKSRENFLIDKAGGINIFRDVKDNSFTPSNEEIISRNPEAIILTADTHIRDIETIKDIIKKRPGWINTDAVSNNRIYVIEEQTTWANPRIVLGLETLSHCLHPELFSDN